MQLGIYKDDMCGTLPHWATVFCHRVTQSQRRWSQGVSIGTPRGSSKFQVKHCDSLLDTSEILWLHAGHESYGQYTSQMDSTVAYTATASVQAMLCWMPLCIVQTSALTLLVGWHEGHPACKNLMLVCWWRWFDWSFACLIAPVVTTNSIMLSSNKTQNGDILVPSNPGPPGKRPLKRRDREVQMCMSTGFSDNGGSSDWHHHRYTMSVWHRDYTDSWQLTEYIMNDSWSVKTSLTFRYVNVTLFWLQITSQHFHCLLRLQTCQHFVTLAAARWQLPVTTHCYNYYRQDLLQSGKLPVLNLLKRAKISIFAPGWLIAPIHVKFGMA